MGERFNSIFRRIAIYSRELLLISTSRRFYSRKDADLLWLVFMSFLQAKNRRRRQRSSSRIIFIRRLEQWQDSCLNRRGVRRFLTIRQRMVLLHIRDIRSLLSGSLTNWKVSFLLFEENDRSLTTFNVLR